jgi:hypothetical protein
MVAARGHVQLCQLIQPWQSGSDNGNMHMQTPQEGEFHMV